MNYFDNEPKKFLSRLAKGPPNHYRYLAWKVIARNRCQPKKGLYEELVEKGKSSSFLHIIEADVGRSFPLIPFFKKGTKYGDAGQRSLTNVLQAYSVYDENVGYC